MKALTKLGIILFVGLLWFPTTVEFAHIFVGHEHEICKNHSETHLHGKNVDCELFSFQKENFSYPELFNYSLLSPDFNPSEQEAQYLFLNTITIHAFKQRGPPGKTS